MHDRIGAYAGRLVAGRVAKVVDDLVRELEKKKNATMTAMAAGGISVAPPAASG